MENSINYQKQFYQGAKNGDVNAMKAAIINVDVSHLIDLSFIEAASNGHLDTVKYLLESPDLEIKADIHSQEDRAFAWACNNQHWEVANYLLEQGANISADNHYVYTMMVEKNVKKDNNLFIEAFEQLKKAFKTMKEKDQSFFISFAIQKKDTQLHNFIENLKIESFQDRKSQNKKFDKNYLRHVITEKNYNLIKQYVEHYKIDETIVDKILHEKDLEAYIIIKDKVEFTDKNKWFFKALEKSPIIALEIFTQYSDFFEKSTDYSCYDNYNNSYQQTCNNFFPSVAVLPRNYSGIQYSNNKEAFAAMLLDTAMDCYEVSPHLLTIFEYIITNRKQYNLQDKDIVQYFVEKNYEIEYAFEETPEVYNPKKDKLVYVLNRLIKEKIDFSSDQSGYIVQIAAYHEVTNLETLLINVIENGSNSQKFLNRFNDNSNWLTEDDEKLLSKTDYHGDRRYDIYKKFDEGNNIREAIIAKVIKAGQYVKLNNNLPIKEISANKIKI